MPMHLHSKKEQLHISLNYLIRNTLGYLRLFAGMDFMFSKFYIFVTYSCFDYSLKEY